MALLSEHVEEAYGATLEFCFADSELRHPLLDESAESSGLGNAGQVTFHVGHEARNTGLAEGFRHDLEGDSLAGTCGSGNQTVPVCHFSCYR